ncbi:MAG: hypothetical protein AAF840_17870, partial [Bacteroidota bacterium]
MSKPKYLPKPLQQDNDRQQKGFFKGAAHVQPKLGKQDKKKLDAGSKVADVGKNLADNVSDTSKH